MKVIRDRCDVQLLVETGRLDKEAAKYLEELIGNLKAESKGALEGFYVVEDLGRVVITVELDDEGAGGLGYVNSSDNEPEVLRIVPEWFEIIEVDALYSLPGRYKYSFKGYVLEPRRE